MKEVRKLALVLGVAVAALIVAGAVYVYRHGQPNDDHTPAERRQIAEACLALLQLTPTNENDDIKPGDPRIPEAIRALRPTHIEVMPNFAVDIWRKGNPPEYFLMRLSHPTNTWALCVAGPALLSTGGGREILRIEHD